MPIYSSQTKQSKHWPFNSGITEHDYANQYWRSLHYFNLYRFIIGSILVIITWKFQLADFGSYHYLLFLYTCLGYIFFSSMVMLLIKLRYPNINWQLTIQIVGDIVFFSVMLYASGGIQSGLGDLLLVSLAGAGLINRGHLVLFFASIATISLLLQETYSLLTIDSYPIRYAQAGLLSMAYFAVACLARQLAKHILVSEQLVKEHSIDLVNMAQVNQLVIQDLQEGILVVDKYGNIRQRNTLAEKLLNLDSSTHQTELLKLSDYVPEIANRLTSWQGDNHINFDLLRLDHSNALVRTRFLPIQSDFRNGVVIFLEDMERIQAQLQQLKLAALGRLTANIAHEIRNPLSAINHAAELLKEEQAKNTTSIRLAHIIRDNTQRLNKIVQDVLQLNRLNISKPEAIDTKEFIERFLEEFCHTENINMNVFLLDSSKNYWINFDRDHLNQVLWNLCRNAWRHC
nr:two-component sensor histidine kinase [Nitrosomonas sp.]